MLTESPTDRTIYHYTDVPGLRGILAKREIWATRIEDLADETELEYGRNLVLGAFAEAEEKAPPGLSARLLGCITDVRELPYLTGMIARAGHEPNVDNPHFAFHVVSFCEQGDSLPLWRGFTPGCAGFAVGVKCNFDATDKDGDYCHGYPKKVAYSPAEQQRIASEIAADSIRRLDDKYDPFAWTGPLGDMLYLKDAIFSSEDEWRVIYTPGDRRCKLEVHMRYVDGHLRPIRFVKLPMKHLRLVEIICGPRSPLRADNKKDKEEIIAALTEGGHDAASVKIGQSSCRLWR